MKLEKMKDLDYIEIIPVSVKKKDQLIYQPHSNRSNKAGVGIAKNGKYQGKLIVFSNYLKQEIHIADKTMSIIPKDAILSLLDLEDDYELDSPTIDIDRDYSGEDWINAVK